MLRERRASSESAVKRRAAMAIVSPVNLRIQHWQEKAVRLRAIGESRHQRQTSELLGDVDELASEVTLQIYRLGATLDEPSAIDIGRVQDTLKALESLKKNLAFAREVISAR